MTIVQMLELALAAAIFAGGIWLYRRPNPDGYGSQGAVLLFVVAVLLAVHAFGVMNQVFSL